MSSYSDYEDIEEISKDKDGNIELSNGWVVSIVENNGVDTYKPNGEHIKEFKSNKNYSVTMCDYNGYFDWDILNQFGAIDGCIYCDDGLEILVTCETIRRL